MQTLGLPSLQTESQLRGQSIEEGLLLERGQRSELKEDIRERSLRLLEVVGIYPSCSPQEWVGLACLKAPYKRRPALSAHTVSLSFL